MWHEENSQQNLLFDLQQTKVKNAGMKILSYIGRSVFLPSFFASVIAFVILAFVQEAAAASVLPCTAKEIKATTAFEPYMHRAIMVIRYRNMSSSSCGLYGWPVIMIKDDNGFVYETRVINTTQFSEGDIGSVEYPKLLVVTPQKIALTAVDWHICGPHPKGKLGIFVILPHDTSPIKLPRDPDDPNLPPDKDIGDPYDYSYIPIEKCFGADATWMHMGAFEPAFEEK